MSALGQKQTLTPQKAMSALPPKADMCSALANVRFGPEADMCSARLVSAKGQRRKSFQGLLGWQIGHWRSPYRVFDHRGGWRGLRLDADIIGEAKPTAARSAADLSAPKRAVCCKSFVMERSDSNFLFRAYVFANASAGRRPLSAVALGTSQWDRYSTGGGAQKR